MIPRSNIKRAGRIALALLLAGCVLASCHKQQAANSHGADYQAGYQAGRRDELTALCNMFEKHKAAMGTLGEARLRLIRGYCASRL